MKYIFYRVQTKFLGQWTKCKPSLESRCVIMDSSIKYREAIILLYLAIFSGSTQSQSTVLSPDVASCPDVEVTFTCQAPPESNVLTWFITLIRNGTELMDQLPLRGYLMNDQPGSATVRHGEFSFQFTLLETSPALRSTMTTSLPLSLNTTMVECLPNVAGTGFTSDISSFLFVVPSRPQRLTPSIQMSDSDGVNLTVTWDPTAESVSYQVIVAPASRSGQSVFVTILTSLRLTLEYSINYTVQVVAYNCVGNSSATTLTITTGCPMLSTTNSVIIDTYTGREEGSKVTFHCNEGLIPSGEMMSTCSSGRWLPQDPSQLNCQPVNCGSPIHADSVTVEPYESTTEGSVITFHCDDGLIPNKTITATCLRTAQWCPSPNSHTCQVPSAVDCGEPNPPSHGSIALYTSTVKGSVLMFYCNEGYFPTKVISTTCTPDGSWLPNPTDTTCTTVKGPVSRQLSYGGALTLTGVICSTVFFVLGMLCSFLILRYKQSHANKNVQHTETQPPLPVYEDIHVSPPSTGNNKQSIELKENVAYGPI